MDAWIGITLFAVFAQNIRSSLQKHLTTRLSTLGATQVRFFYAIPFALLYLGFLCSVSDASLPVINQRFVMFAVLGAFAQIIATACMVALFSYRNFFVGTAFSKTEMIQAAVLGYLVLGDAMNAGAIIAILIGLAGIVLLSLSRSQPSIAELLLALKSRATILGICCGLVFGVAAISFRGASTALSGGAAIQAAYTLLLVLIIQSLVMSLWLIWREPGQMSIIIRHWKVAGCVGLAGMAASAAWFTAMTLQNAGYVKALGQAELVLAFLVSQILFKEKTVPLEFIGVGLVLASILVLLAFH